jgi:hypothetical protein
MAQTLTYPEPAAENTVHASSKIVLSESTVGISSLNFSDSLSWEEMMIQQFLLVLVGSCCVAFPVEAAETVGFSDEKVTVSVELRDGRRVPEAELRGRSHFLGAMSFSPDALQVPGRYAPTAAHVPLRHVPLAPLFHRVSTAILAPVVGSHFSVSFH